MQGPKPTVIVIGGSVSGLLTAALFANHAHVIIIEKDNQPTQANYLLGRPGTRQDRHLHVLLEGGRQHIETLLPGFSDALIRNGASVVDRAQDISWYHCGVWKKRYRDGGKMYIQTRPVIDYTLRECLHAKMINPNELSCWYGTRVVNLVVRDDVVVGVILDTGVTVYGDLVADCSGKCTSAAKLLSAHAFEANPRETTININILYTTLIYELPSTAPYPSEVMMIHPNPTYPHGAACQRINSACIHESKPDKNYFLCTRFGYHGAGRTNVHFAHDFTNELQHLAKSCMYDFLKDATPLNHVVDRYMYTHQNMKHWDELQHLPNGFLSLGDAVCTFDPAFGQGMSYAAIGITGLQPLIHDLARGKMCAQARKILAKTSFVPFHLNAIENFRFSETVGHRPPLIKWIQRFAMWVFLAQASSIEVSRVMLKVAHLEASPLTMLNPLFLFRVIWYGCKSHISK